MSSSRKGKNWWRALRVIAVVSGVGYAVWRYWQAQNQAGASIWAGGTDIVD